ncbi:MAG: permease [Candidatus Saccharimonas sp.]|nr:MAG: permease [Candidatus Saccharimonas sp.]
MKMIRWLAKRWRRVAVVAGVLVGLAALRLVSAQTGQWSLPDRLQDWITLSLSVMIEALPFVMLGICIAIIVQVWLPAERLLTYLPQQPLLRRACLSLLGIALPVCECGNVPLARGLLAKGLTPSESLVFLLAAPILNPVTIITTQQAFAGDMTILWARVFGGFAIANLVGWVYARRPAEELLTNTFVASCQADHVQRSKRVASLAIFRREVQAMLPALVVGAGLAGLVQVLVSREVLVSLGSQPVWSVIAMVALAFIVSICSNVDAFFALAFRQTFMTGALVSFLTFGPMIDIKMLSLLRTTYRPSVLLQVSAIVGLASITLGLVVNYAF